MALVPTVGTTVQLPIQQIRTPAHARSGDPSPEEPKTKRRTDRLISVRAVLRRRRRSKRRSISGESRRARRGRDQPPRARTKASLAPRAWLRTCCSPKAGACIGAGDTPAADEKQACGRAAVAHAANRQASSETLHEKCSADRPRVRWAAAEGRIAADGPSEPFSFSRATPPLPMSGLHRQGRTDLFATPRRPASP